MPRPSTSMPWNAPAFGDLAQALEALGYPVARIEREGGTRALMLDRGGPCRAAVIPIERLEEDLDAELRVLRDLAPSRPLTTLVYGGAPDSKGRRHLSRAGVDLGLFAPLGLNVLRFQLNRALSPPSPTPRQALRAPVDLEVEVRSRLRTRRERLYTLSAAGAFILSDEPLSPGRKVTLRVPVGMLQPEVRGRVVMTNRSEAPEVPELPSGMAIAFEGLDGPSAAVLDHLAHERLAALAICSSLARDG